MGKEWRYYRMNVQLKKSVTLKEKKEKAREKGHIFLFNIFVIIGFNFKKIIRYQINNDVGKIETDTYLEILEELNADKKW